MLRTCLLFALLIQHGLAVVVELNCETLDDEFSTPITNVKLSTYLPALLTFMRQCQVSHQPAMLTKNHPFSIGEEMRDECNSGNHYLLDAESRRVTNDNSEYHDVGFCDYEYYQDEDDCDPTSPDWVVDESIANWYKFDDNSRMHETNTDWPACGGFYVIRLNGIHPTEIGQHYAQFIDDSDRTYEGMMTNCGEFFVYHLPDSRPNSRYCSADVESNRGLARTLRSNTTLLPIPYYSSVEEKMEIWEKMKKDV